MNISRLIPPTGILAVQDWKAIWVNLFFKSWSAEKSLTANVKKKRRQSKYQPMEKREERTVMIRLDCLSNLFDDLLSCLMLQSITLRLTHARNHCYWLPTKKVFSVVCQLVARQVCWIKDEQLKKAIITRTRRESKYSSLKLFCLNRSRCNFRFSYFFVYRLAVGSWFANDEKKTRRNYEVEHGSKSNCLPVAHNRFTDLSMSIYTWTLSIPLKLVWYSRLC